MRLLQTSVCKGLCWSGTQLPFGEELWAPRGVAMVPGGPCPRLLSVRIYTGGSSSGCHPGYPGGDTVNEQRSRPELWALGWPLNGSLSVASQPAGGQAQLGETGTEREVD